MTEANNPVLEKPKPRNPGWDNIKPAQKGEVRNPLGRGVGSRNKLADAFIADCYAAWQEQGSAAIDETIKRKPWEFVKIVSGLMPHKLEITNKFQHMADDDIRTNLTRALGELVSRTDDRLPRRGDGDQARLIEAQAQHVPALPEAGGLPHGGEDSSGTASNGGQSIGEDLCRRS